MTFFTRALFFPPLVVSLLVPAYPQTAKQMQDPDSLFLSALQLQRSGNTDEAKSRFQALLDDFPDYHDARVSYGRLLAWEKNHREAIAQFDSVLFANPSHEEARFAKAQVYAWGGAYRRSADILLVLIREDPSSVLYRLELANVYLSGGSPPRALEQYEHAYLMNPASPEILRGLARCHRKLKNYDLSRYWYEKLLERIPGDSEARSELVQLAYRSTYEIQLRTSYESFSNEGFKPHTIGEFGLYVSVDEDWKPFLYYSRLSRFEKKDDRFGAGTYTTVTYGVSLLVQGIVSPRSVVAPRIDGLLEFDAAVADGMEALAGYRLLAFDSVDVHVVDPGVRLYFSDDVWFTARGYFGFSSDKTSSDSYVATVTYNATPLTMIRVAGFFGNEAFRVTTLSDISNVRTSGAFVSLRSRITPNVALEGLYQFTSRASSSNSHRFEFALSFLF